MDFTWEDGERTIRFGRGAIVAVYTQSTPATQVQSIAGSTDAGRTWSHVGLRQSGQVGAILVDPREPEGVFGAALGHILGPHQERGVVRPTIRGAR